jgi:hypothetical protein
MIIVELGDRRFEDEVAACDLELLHEIGDPGEQYAPALFSIRAKPSAAARCDFPPPGGPKHRRLAPFSIQESHRLDLCFGDHRHGVEVERVEGFSRRQPRFRKIPLEAASASLDHLLFGESGEEASGGPASLSAVAARAAQISLTPERRSSPSSKSMRAASILSLVFMPPLPETRRSRRDGQGGESDDDDRNGGGRWLEAFGQGL